METLDIAVPDGTLRALRFGDGPRSVLAAHGITASAMSWRAVARALPPQWQLVAVDLRGRGGSADAPGPYGMDRHADDLIAIAEGLARPIVLSGQSMGAYPALRAAVRRPDLFTKLVLVDGGLPLPLPPGIDPDAALSAVVGPAIARLAMTFESEQAYLDFFRAHPALSADWNDDLEEYVRYDAIGPADAIRSRVNADAISADGRDMVVNVDKVVADLRALSVPTVLLHAPRGMLGQEPGLLPQPLVDEWVSQTPAIAARLVPDTNHYTILMGPIGAAAVAEALTT
jgi:pimeloyl-ACP methyl ester carboxylesterase